MNKVDCGVIMETHIKPNFVKITYKRVFSFSSLKTNYESHHGGRIWLLWNLVSVHVKLLEKGAQYLHCSLLHHSTQQTIWLTVVYAFNRANERIDLLNKLNAISIGLTGPWLCVGDFNFSLSSDERVGCISQERDIQEFRDWLHTCSLEDHPYTEGVYTWHNKQHLSSRWAKLDRLLVNLAWFLGLTASVVVFPSGISDYAHILLTTPSTSNYHWAFRYLNYSAISPKFKVLVAKSWITPRVGSQIFSLFSHLSNLRHDLKHIHHTEFNGLTIREKTLVQEFVQLKNAKLKMLAQKAKIQYLKLSDSNTRYFYASIAARRVQNTIGTIADVRGIVCLGQENVAQAFLTYYQDLLGTS
ncbi:uncharacterized protein LOC141595065 [Silene latifolia]|uniref:uncharacterized protein LOC141595065 n=1 Tax=Silene latifolia TaxID=37657 RepID=UPI003D778BBD